MMNFDEKLTEFLEKHDIIVRAEDAALMSQDDFKEIRFDGFGASDSSRIMNVNPFPGGSPQELLQDKINRVHDETIGHKASVRMGRELEDFIIEKTERLLGVDIFKPSHMYGKEHNGLNTNFDGVMITTFKPPKTFEKNVIVPAEIKTISHYGSKYYDFDKGIALEDKNGEVIIDPLKRIQDFVPEMVYAPETYKPELKAIERHILYNAEKVGIPAYYYTQLQQQIDFLQADYGYLIALNSKTWTLHVFVAERDDHTIKSLNNRASKLFAKLKEAREKETI